MPASGRATLWTLASLWAALACGGAEPRARAPSAPASRVTHAEERPGPWHEAAQPAMPSTEGGPLVVFHGQASYYADSLAGHRTANGERYDPREYTAAHRTLAFGTVVRVVRPDTGAWVTVRVTDRGPYAPRRVLDLSRAAAERLNMIRVGVVEVRAEVIRYGVARARNRAKRGRAGRAQPSESRPRR